MKYKSYMNVSKGRWGLDKGAGMIEINLLDSLVSCLSELFKDYELKAKSGLQQNVKVFAQFLPQPKGFEVVENSDDYTVDDVETVEPLGYSEVDIEANFPCIIVALDGTEVKEEGTTDAYRIKVNILAGVYDDDANMQGYRDVLDILEKTRQYLLSIENRILVQRYQLEMPMTSDLGGNETFPFYFGELNTIWETARPLMSY